MKSNQGKDALQALKTIRELLKHDAPDVAKKVCEEFFGDYTRDQECEHCGFEFVTGVGTGRTKKAKYCSDRCRVYAFRARNNAVA